jgi:hypothetical protein
MKRIVNSLFIGAILAMCAGTAFAADPAVGTWNLNLAKSTFNPGPAPKAQTRTYAESAQGTTVTTKTTAADGKESTNTLTFKEDGKPYPISGSPNADMVSITRVDPLTIHGTRTKAGAVVGTVVRSVSKDGKTLTFKENGVDAKGVKFNDVLIYDRQ